MLSSYNIKNIRELYRMTQEQFGASLGITRELVNKIEKGKTKISKGTALRLEKFVRDKGCEFNSHEVVSYNPSQIPGISLLPQSQQLNKKNTDQRIWVPLIGIKAQAGYIRGYEQVDFIESLEKYSLPPGVYPGGAQWSYFEIDGDSMEPTFSSGDMILASMVHTEDWQDIKNLNVYIVLTADSLLIKRIFRKSKTEWLLISDNIDTCPGKTVSVSNIKELWVFRRHIHARIPMPEYNRKMYDGTH